MRSSRLLDEIRGRAGATHQDRPGRHRAKSRIVANFLLAWWNAAECGGFDLTDVWGVDTEIALDMLRVFALIAGCHQYPDTMGYGKQLRGWLSSAHGGQALVQQQ